jgi:hypothetical protein
MLRQTELCMGFTARGSETMRIENDEDGQRSRDMLRLCPPSYHNIINVSDM